MDRSTFNPDAATNLFQGTNVQTIVVETPVVPHFALGHRIGFWGATWLPLDGRPGVRQLDRAAQPLVSTLFGQDDPYNAALPADDVATYGPTIRGMVERVVAANQVATSRTDPKAYAKMVQEALLPDVLEYTVGTEAYWFAKAPAGHQYARNGRDLTGNHPDQMFELVLNTAVNDGLSSDDATGDLRQSFPYLSLPV